MFTVCSPTLATHLLNGVAIDADQSVTIHSVLTIDTDHYTYSIIFVKTSITCTVLMTKLRIYSYTAIPHDQFVLWHATDLLQPCTARLAIYISFE